MTLISWKFYYIKINRRCTLTRYRTIRVLQRLDRACRSGKSSGIGKERRKKPLFGGSLDASQRLPRERSFAHVLQFLPPQSACPDSSYFFWPHHGDACSLFPCATLTIETPWPARSSTGTSSLRSRLASRRNSIQSGAPIRRRCCQIRNFKLTVPAREWILRWMIERHRAHRDFPVESWNRALQSPVKSLWSRPQPLPAWSHSLSLSLGSIRVALIAVLDRFLVLHRLLGPGGRRADGLNRGRRLHNWLGLHTLHALARRDGLCRWRYVHRLLDEAAVWVIHWNNATRCQYVNRGSYVAILLESRRVSQAIWRKRRNLARYRYHDRNSRDLLILIIVNNWCYMKAEYVTRTMNIN